MGECDVLVTGGAGYIGSHVCKALAESGYTPITYDDLSIDNRRAVRWGPLEVGDIRDPARLNEVFLRHRPAGVLHFAALSLVGESMIDPARYWNLNLQGAQCVFDAARRHGVRGLVFSSTCAIYGIPASVPIDEDAPTNPVNPYGATKLAAERMLGDYGAAYDLPHLILRYFNAAGADPEVEIGERRDVETHLVPLAIDASLGRRGPLRVMGDDYPTPDGTAIRDYVHVADLARAHVAGLEKLFAGAASRTLNIGTGRGTSVREILDAVEAATGHEVPTVAAPRRPGDPPELVANAARARDVLGPDHLPRSDIDTIVRTALAWHRTLEDPTPPGGGPGGAEAHATRSVFSSEAAVGTSARTTSRIGKVPT